MSGGRPTSRPSREEWATLCSQHTGVQLQERFGVCAATIWRWSDKLGASPIGGPASSKAPDDRKRFGDGQRRNLCPGEEVVRAALEGRTIEEAAALLRCAEGTLRRWRRELGILGKPVAKRLCKRPTPGRWAELCRRHTSRELRELFDVSWWTIWNWSRQLGATPIGGAASKKPANHLKDREPKPRLDMPTVSDAPRPQYWLQPNHRLVVDEVA